jgi:RNA polymerase sigma factor (sigma-70 family)
MPPADTTTDPTSAPRELRPALPREVVDPAAAEIMRRHGGEVLAVARRWADTPEDAEDAYQRGLEIMLTKAPSTDPDHLVPWLKTVVKREAWAIRRQRERHTPSAPESDELDGEAPGSAHDHAELAERLRVGAEAMGTLKPQEVRALVLRAEGLSYREICEETGWTYTKVNRCLSEGRRRFAARLAGIESGAECDRLAPQLSALADGEARAEDMALLRPHLRTCLVCRARLRDYRAAPARVAAMTPPVAASGLLAAARELIAAIGVRWHQAAELAAGHKVAAVVASSAALAGGGAATVATVEGGGRSAAVPPAPARSIASSPRPSGNESAESRNATASKGDATERAAVRDGTPSTGRTSTSATRLADESSPPSPSAGEFTPDPAPAEPAARKPRPPARAADSEPESSGEFSP